MDNTNLDTSTAALLIFSRAELLSYQNKDSLALLTIDSLLRDFPNHMLTDEAWYKKALIYKKTAQFEKALPFLADIVEKYGGRIYLSKDSLMSASHFQKTYPRLEEFKRIRKQYGAEGYFTSAQSKRIGLDL